MKMISTVERTIGNVVPDVDICGPVGSIAPVADADRATADLPRWASRLVNVQSVLTDCSRAIGFSNARVIVNSAEKDSAGDDRMRHTNLVGIAANILQHKKRAG